MSAQSASSKTPKNTVTIGDGVSINVERNSLFVPLALLGGALILIGLIIALTLIPAQLLSRTLSTQIGVQQEQLAGSLSHQMELLFNVTANNLLSLTERPEIQTSDSIVRLAALKELGDVGTQAGGQIKAIIRLDQTGQPIYAWPDGINQQVGAGKALEWTVDGSWVQAIAKTSGVQFKELSTGRNLVFLLAEPITAAGQLPQALVFQIDMKDYFSTNFSSIKLSATAQLWLFDLRGRTLYQRDPNLAWPGSVADILSVHDIVRRTQFPTDDRDSVIAPVYTAFTQDRARTASLVLILSRMTSEGQGELYSTLNALFVAGIVIVLLVIVMAFAVGRFMLGESRRRSTVRTLLDMSRVLNSSLDLPIVLKQILQQLAALLPFEGASVMLLGDDEENPTVIVEAQQGDLEIEGAQFPLDTVVAARSVIQSARPLIINDTRSDSRWNPTTVSVNIASWMGVPLRQRNTVIGVLNINSTVQNHFRSEQAAVAQAFADQASVAIQNARAFEAQIRQYETELETARLIQNSLLPSEVPPMPELEIAVHSTPAQHVSGDYYQYLPLPDGRMGVAVGDVSGKGMPAALLMAVICTSLREEVLRYPSAAGLLTQLNKSLLVRLQTNHMNTALIAALFDPKTRQVELANAGMVHPYVRNATGWEAIVVNGYPIGAAERTVYTSKTLSLAPGSMLVIFSDGVIEAQNRAGEFFGFERVETLLNKTRPEITSAQLITYILAALQAHSGDYEVQDDLPSVVIKSVEN